MKLFYVLSISLFALPSAGSAQYLADNVSVTTPLLLRHTVSAGHERQEWQKEQDRVNGHIPNSKLTKMKNVTESIMAYFQDSCITQGEYNPIWHGEYFSGKSGAASLMNFNVTCNFDDRGSNDQRASLSILANDLRPLLNGNLIVGSQNFLTMQPVAGIKKDLPYFEYSVANAGTNGSVRTRIWMISTGTGATQLPYIPVTRKEYLQAAILELTGIRDAVIKGLKETIPVRPVAVQEADKKAELEHLSAIYSGMDLQVKTRMFLADYKSDEDYLKERIHSGTAALDKTIHLLDSLGQLAPAELNKPAIVSVKAIDFSGFEDGVGDQMLIRVNPSWVSSEGKEKPQFLLVSWQFDPSASLAGTIDMQMQERFDGQQLVSMLK